MGQQRHVCGAPGIMGRVANMNPVVIVCPYLPLREPAQFSGWWLGPLAEFDGLWLSRRFENCVRKFLQGFRDSGGAVISSPALVAREASGVDGVPPTMEEQRALGTTIAYATIDANPYWGPGSQAWNVATTDNADMWVQPLDVEEGGVTFERGGRVRIQSAGHRFRGQGFSVPPPLELHLPSPVTLDGELLMASYQVLRGTFTEHGARAARLEVAMRWLVKSWLNSASIAESDRLVFLKIASEALTGQTRKSRRAAAQLRRIFEGALAQEGDGFGIEELLWDPDEPCFPRDGCSLTALEHWYMALADARNKAVHGAPSVPLTYEQSGSSYVGPFAEVGDRVLREAINVELGACGYPAVWRRGFSRGSFKALQYLRSQESPKTEPRRFRPDNMSAPDGKSGSPSAGDPLS